MATPSGNGWCERLYSERAAGLILYGRSLGLSHGEAEDVVQETFVALLRLESVPDEPENYCLRAFRNHALNFRRGLWRRVAREFESVRWFERAPDESPAERTAMCRLAGLPVEQREAIVLKLWHGLTFAEIGGLLGISPNTAAGRYRYGIQKLRQCLKGEKIYEQIESESESGRAGGEPFAFLDSASTVVGA
ncbi:MAG: sigma-70 family RNA polymerase sigma factor [Verrucomicrobia bacterium]|nr:sigma-70 family RNA polymerase sigma factor [Verrucomicrobiota bacterium]